MTRPILLTAVLAVSPFVHAQEASAERRFGATPMFGVTVGQPQGLSASAGLIIGTVPAKPVKCAFGYWSNGLFIQAEPGVGGGKASVGLATSNNLFGVAVKASALRTWGATWGTQAGATYLGPELEFAAFAKFNAGWLWRTGASNAKSSMFTWGVGIGF